jgi:hypothetical protein
MDELGGTCSLLGAMHLEEKKKNQEQGVTGEREGEESHACGIVCLVFACIHTHIHAQIHGAAALYVE